MSDSELSEKNYRKIFWLNSLLTVPMMLLFSWPYYEFSHIIGLSFLFSAIGSFTFALPFTLTVMHGYVTKSLGTMHRNHYYLWLRNKSLSYGILFRPILIRTRFRLTLFIISLLILITGYFVH